MAKGIGEQTTSTGFTFLDLPEHERDAAEAEACQKYTVENFWDLGPAIRREVREHAVADHLRKL